MAWVGKRSSEYKRVGQVTGYIGVKHKVVFVTLASPLKFMFPKRLCIMSGLVYASATIAPNILVIMNGRLREFQRIAMSLACECCGWWMKLVVLVVDNVSG